MIRRNMEQGAQGMQAMARAFGFGGGGGGGGGGFGGAGPQRWVDRPGEQGAPAGGQGGRGAAPPPGGQQAMGLDQSQLFDIMRALGVTQGGGGGGGGFGGAVPIANEGDYLVSMTVDGQTMKQVLRVERRAGGDSSGFPFEVEEMIKAYDRYLRDRH